MNNRERQWYEGKYGWHPASCNCVSCCDARRLKEQREQEIAEEQSRMQVGATERVGSLKEGDKNKELPKVDWSWLGKMGMDSQWKLAYEGEALVVSSGLVYTKQTKPKGLILPEVLEMIKEHPKSSYYERKLRRRLTLGDALAQGRLDDIGKEMDFSVSLNLINPPHDRDFSHLPQTGQQLLSKKFRSKPIRV